MEIDIIENKKQSLYAYKNDELLFYSTIKFNWNKRIIEIYNHNDDLLLELRVKNSFLKTTFEILLQNQLIKKDITDINETYLFFDQNRSIRKSVVNYFSFNSNFTYFSENNIIAHAKQKMWSRFQKITLHVNDENLESLDQIIIHVLAVRTGYNAD